MENKQPAPKNEGIVIFNLVPSHLDKIENKSYNSEVLQELVKRYEFGLSKYGIPLMSDDGRDSVRDINEELLDAIMYTIKAKYNKCNLTSTKKLLYVLTEIINQ